jgi:uncharacterized protein (TIRG00374 family)
LGGAALALLFWSFRGVELGRVVSLLGALGPLVSLILLPQLLAFVAETWGWRRALRSAGHSVGFSSLFAVRVASEALGQTLPGGAVASETLKPALLAKNCGLSVGAGVGTTAHRKFLRVTAHGLYVVAATILGFETLRVTGAAWTGSEALPPVILCVGLALVCGSWAMAGLLARGRIARRLHSLLLRVPSAGFRSHLRKTLHAFSETDRHTAVFFALGPRKTALPVLACVFAWMCEALESWLILALLGGAVGFHAVLGLDMAVSLARQTLFLLPSGIGVQDAGYLSALQALGVPDALTVGAAFVMLKRGKEVFWILIGLLGLFFARGSRGPTIEQPGDPPPPLSSGAPSSLPS